jgi:hypothetical protein
LIFKANFVYLGLFLAEILHQRNAAWAYPGAGPAFDAVGQIMRGRFVVLLAFTEPVQLLRQKVGRAGISAGATANAAFSSSGSPISAGDGASEQLVILTTRNVQRAG